MTELDTSGIDEIVAPSDEALATIGKLANQQLAAIRRVEQLNEELRAAKADLTKISQDLLPDAMKAVGLQEFTLDSGEKITIKEDVYASIPNGKLADAVRWFREHNHGAIIKNQFKVDFGAGDDEQAGVVATFLDSNGLDYDQKLSVHPGTLKRWVKDQLAEGNEVPETITYYEFRESKIK